MFCMAVCFLTVSAFLSAQTAAELDTIMESSAVSCAQAARFVSGAAGGEDSPENTALLPEGAAPDDPVTLGQLSFMMMKAFNIKGGMMYAIFPGPRYAFRTMTGRSLIQGAADPAMTVSGERFLQILGNVLNVAGEEP